MLRNVSVRHNSRYVRPDLFQKRYYVYLCKRIPLYYIFVMNYSQRNIFSSFDRFNKSLNVIWDWPYVPRKCFQIRKICDDLYDEKFGITVSVFQWVFPLDSYIWSTAVFRDISSTIFNNAMQSSVHVYLDHFRKEEQETASWHFTLTQRFCNEPLNSQCGLREVVRVRTRSTITRMNTFDHSNTDSNMSAHHWANQTATGPFYWHGITLTSARIINYVPGKCGMKFGKGKVISFHTL